MNSSWLKRSPILYGGRKMETTACPKKTDRSPSTSMGARSGFVHAAGTPGARSAGCSAMPGFYSKIPGRARFWKLVRAPADTGATIRRVVRMLRPAASARRGRSPLLRRDARDAAPDRAEDLVRDRVAESGQIVGGDALRLLIAHQHDLVADADTGNVRDVDHRHVHAD